MSDLRVYRRHMYADDPNNPKHVYCARGSRAFFKRHGLEWSDFVRNGIPATDFERIGDAMALRAVDHAREENEQ